MDKLTKELLNLKEQIEVTKIKKAQLEGKKETYIDTLKKQFNCNNIKQAEIKLKKLTVELDVIRVDIKNEYERMCEEYGY